MASIQEILSAKVTTRVVSRVAGTTSRLLNFFGMQPGGRNTTTRGHRQFGYDVYNNVRKMGQGRAPGAPAASVRRNPVGRVDGVFPRMYEKLTLQAEELHNYRPIGGASNTFDSAGQSYVANQRRTLGERAANFRLGLLGGMMRGAVYGHRDGDDLYYNYTSSGSAFPIDYRVPAGNKSKLNMLGAGDIINASWATATTNIPLHLTQIDAALQQVTGTRLDLIVCGGKLWQYVLNNNYVTAQAGTANRPFQVFEREVGFGDNGLPLTQKTGVLSCAPFITWLITDEGLELGAQGSETYTPFIEENNFWFGPNPTPNMFQMLEGSEPVVKTPNGRMEVVSGLDAWTMTTFDPAGYNLFGVDNCIPANYIPAASGYGLAVF